MIQRSIIHIQLADDKIPFDVSLYRAIKFSRLRPSDLRRAREDLKLAIRATLVEGYEVDNPVTRARGQINIEQRATPEQRLIFDQLKDLQERVELIDRRQVSEMVEERAISRGNLEGYYRMTVAFDPKYPDLKRAMSDAERFVIRHFPLEHMSSAGDRITVRLRKNVTEMEKDLVDRLSRMPGVQDITAE